MAMYLHSPTGEPRRNPAYAEAQIIEIPARWASVGSPWNLVKDRFTVTAEYAANSYAMTSTYIAEILRLVEEVEEFDIPDIDVEIPEIPDIDYGSRPPMGDLPLDETWPPNTSVRPSLVDVPEIDVPEFPVFNIPDPDILLPPRPEERPIQGPGDAPVPDTIDIPQAPPVTLPPPPSLQDIVLPSPPEITLPEFEGTVDAPDITDPVQFSWNESPFNSDIWRVFLDKVIAGIRDGGTGLDPGVEQQIWARALLRQQQDNDRAYEEIENYHAAKGWDMPQGALAGQLQEKSDEIDRGRRETNIDIAVKQAELAQQNDQFLLQMGKDAELILRDFHNAQMNRALEASKAAATNSIELLNGRIAKYNTQIEKYKADAQVFGERIKAALVHTEIFKSQIEGAKVSVEVQANLVQLYDKQLQGIKSAIDVYVAQVEGARIHAQIEGIKIQSFGERVSAYVAEISGEKARYETYATAVGAETSKMALFSERVKAFSEETRAKGLLVEAQDKVAGAKINRNNGEIERYKAELAAYSMETEAVAKKIGAIVDAYRGEVDAYSAETNAEASRLSVLVKEIDARIQLGRFNLEKALAEVEAATSGYVAIKKLQLDGITGITQVGAQLAASAMNAVSATASYGYSGSESVQTGFSYGASSSEQHSFSHPTPQLPK
jgi:hypothetical protein